MFIIILAIMSLLLLLHLCCQLPAPSFYKSKASFTILYACQVPIDYVTVASAEKVGKVSYRPSLKFTLLCEIKVT